MNKSRQVKLRMQESFIGALLPTQYFTGALGSILLKRVTRMEGGQFTSRTLRRVLHERFDVTVGDYSYGSLLSPGACDSKTTIGSYVSIGPNVRRYGASHPLSSGVLHPFFYNPRLGLEAGTADVERNAISIGHDVWIGANTVILPGCSRIGTGAVIGAGSVVTKDVPDFAIAAGNPARVLRMRFPKSAQASVLATRFWEFGPVDVQTIKRNLDLDIARHTSQASDATPSRDDS